MLMTMMTMLIMVMMAMMITIILTMGLWFGDACDDGVMMLWCCGDLMMRRDGGMMTWWQCDILPWLYDGTLRWCRDCMMLGRYNDMMM